MARMTDESDKPDSLANHHAHLGIGRPCSFGHWRIRLFCFEQLTNWFLLGGFDFGETHRRFKYGDSAQQRVAPAPEFRATPRSRSTSASARCSRIASSLGGGVAGAAKLLKILKILNRSEIFKNR